MMIIILTPMMISMVDMGVKKHAHQIVIIIIIFGKKYCYCYYHTVIIIIINTLFLFLFFFCFVVDENNIAVVKQQQKNNNNNLCHNRSIYQQQYVVYGFFIWRRRLFLVENSISFFLYTKKILFTRNIAPDIILILLWRPKKKFFYPFDIITKVHLEFFCFNFHHTYNNEI